MARDSKSFGEALAELRWSARLRQKELAALVLKEDGRPISPQYVNDLEHDRRNPPSAFLIKQFAKALGVSPDYLYHCAGVLPEDLKNIQTSKESVIAAYKVFRRALNKRAAA
jgi:transcriptional regulator with XRE-family HTH domain